VTGEVVTEVEGADALAASLSRVGAELDNLEAAGTKVGQLVKARAQSNAPVNTGALVRSIRAEATGTTVNVGAYTRYAAFQEFGTVYVPASPYLRPALESATTEIVAAYTEEIQSKLETVKGA
jgi:HK97 gp10 family phage protein